MDVGFFLTMRQTISVMEIFLRKKQTVSFYDKFRAFHERIQVLTLTLQQEEAKCTKLKTKVLQEEIFQGWIFW